MRAGRYRFLELLDVDGDGGFDLVSGDEGQGIEVFRGTPDGEFAEPVISNFGVTHEDIVFGKIDGDGFTDLAASMGRDVGILLGAGNGRFRCIEGYEGGRNTLSLVLEDLDGDGDLDVVTANDSDYLVSVLENLGGGIYSEAGDFGMEDDARQLAVADYDSDGILDLAVVRLDFPCLAILRGLGDLEYGPPELHDFSLRGWSIAASDLEGDGHVDLLLSSRERVLVLQGDGEAGFERIGTCTTGLSGNIVYILASDLDSDGYDDLVVVSEEYPGPAAHVSVFPGGGDGSFGAPVSYPVPSYPVMATAGFLDGDLHPDLAVALSGPGTGWEGSVALLFGTGHGSFGDAVIVPAGQDTRWVGITDINHDGAADLVASNNSTMDISVSYGDGTGLFNSYESYVAGAGPASAALGDIDGDGDLDVITDGSHYSWGSGITVLRNRTVANDVTRACIVTGPGVGPANPPDVRLFAVPDVSAPAAEWTAYGATGYGVNVAAGDIDNDGLPEILTGPGPGAVYGPHVRAFLLDGSPVPGFDFMAYGTLKYGVNIAAGDIDFYTYGDEIITGAGPGAVFGPHVRGWKWEDQGPVQPLNVSFFAYGTPKWGVNVACGNLDGYAYDEIVTGPGPGAVYGPHVRAFGYGGAPITEVSFFAYGTLQYGVKVACGDIDGDGCDEIVTGPGPGPMFAPHVRGWNWDGDGLAEPMEAVNFLAFDNGWYGVNVSCADLDGDGIDEILTGRGPGPVAGRPGAGLELRRGSGHHDSGHRLPRLGAGSRHPRGHGGRGGVVSRVSAYCPNPVSVGGRWPASRKAGSPISTPQEWKRSLESRGSSPRPLIEE